MRLYKILFFSLLLFLIACRPKVPEGIIKEDKMIPLLIDIHLVDGNLYNNMNRPGDTVNKIAMNMYAAVFRKHQTDSNRFKKSFKYYSGQPERLGKIYEAVVNNLTAKNDRLNKAYQDSIKKVVRKDSLKNAARLDSLKKIAKRDSLKIVFKKDSIHKIAIKDSLEKVKKDSLRKVSVALKKAKKDSVKEASRKKPLKKPTQKLSPLLPQNKNDLSPK